MFFKKKRKKPTPVNPNVATVNWIIVGFLLLGYVVNLIKHPTINPIQNVAEIKASIIKAAPAIPEGFTDYKNLLPPEPAVVAIKDTQAGTGEPAICGQDVTIAYKAAAGDGKPLPEKADKDTPLTFRIGEHKVMPALEQGVTGMKQDGERTVTSPPLLAYDSRSFARKDVPKGTTAVFDVDLLAVKPTLPNRKDNPFHINDVQRGMGQPILCGTPATVHITVWDREGKKLFSTHDGDKGPITFTVGQSEVFLGLEQGVIGMSADGKRSLAVPPAYQKTLRGNAPAIEIPFPPKQTVLVGVEAMP